LDAERRVWGLGFGVWGLGFRFDTTVHSGVGRGGCGACDLVSDLRSGYGVRGVQCSERF
jgi:hypothetical protein